MTLHPQRAQMKYWMGVTLADNYAHHNWIYAAIRPLYALSVYIRGKTVKSDCSTGARSIARLAGAPDPCDRGYDPYGNSQTICLANHHMDSAGQLEVGDMISVGVDGGEHIVVVMEAGPDPLCWSDGHQGAPNTYRNSYDSRYPKQYIKMPIPDHPDPPQKWYEKRNTWFDWMKWKGIPGPDGKLRAEGEWKKYKPSDPSVRPHVPTRIPAKWWVRRAKFLINRKRGNKPKGGNK